MGFNLTETEDAMQEIVIILLQREESWWEVPLENRQALLPAIVDNILCKVIRNRSRRQRRERNASITEDALYSDVEMIRATDITSIIRRLNCHQRRICTMLAAGCSINNIALELSSGWHVVRREIEKIRIIFEEAGLDMWLEE